MVLLSSRYLDKALPDVPDREGTESSITIKEQRLPRSISMIEYDEACFEPNDKEPSSRTSRAWKPPTQNTLFILAVVAASCGVIAMLQTSLIRSNRDDGIIFASNVNKLPPGQTFCYLYLPVIVSLFLSFTWAWIDLDVKRLQPFWQLSRKGGAQGRESMLLQYPFDFVAFVPFKAIKNRHWPVLSASFAVVLIFWGLTPLQSAMFATKTVSRVSTHSTAHSTSYLSLEKQEALLGGSYLQSAYNIAWNNETLPSFMSREGMLAPFGFVQPPENLKDSETWTAKTRLYSVDINCYDAIDNGTQWDALNGCTYDKANLEPPVDIRNDQYISSYVGYWYEEFYDSYLACGYAKVTNQTFFLQWSRGRQEQPSGMLGPIAATTLWCESSYYQQDVNATVTPPHMSVARFIPVGDKQPLPVDLINTTDFEWSMSAGIEKFQNRGNYLPIKKWPDTTERTQYLDLAAVTVRDTTSLPPLSGFAIAAYQRPAADYMDATLLRESYQAAYRLLFARRLADILSAALNQSSNTEGTRTYQSQAVVLVPSFVYTVEILLAITALVALAILRLAFVTTNSLRSDPCNILSLMTLAAEDPVLCQTLGQYDRSSSDDLDEAFSDSTFCLLGETNSGYENGLKILGHPSGERAVPKTILPADRQLPLELSWISGGAFVTFQICVIAGLVYTLAQAKANNGLPLPSQSLFVNQLVENYLPMAVAAFFEPIWVVLVRMMCMLQPYEQLRKGRGRASRTLAVDYNSLPPQAVVGRALQAGHISLALICMMTILANVLSVAFNRILFEDTVDFASATTFEQPYQLPLDATSIGNASFAVDVKDYDPFLTASSNLTMGTSLPKWTDNRYFYLPFGNQTLSENNNNNNNNNNTILRATTKAVSSSLECVSLAESGPNNYSYAPSMGFSANHIHFNAGMVFTDSENGCRLDLHFPVPYYAGDSIAGEVLSFAESGTISTCSNIVVAGWLRLTGTSPGVDSNATVPCPTEATWIACRPKVDVTNRQVTVGGDGLVLSSESSDQDMEDAGQIFEPDMSGYIESMHWIFSQNDYDNPMWHTDAYPCDPFNFLLAAASNSSNFLNPTSPVPSSESAIAVFSAVYAKLSAITLGTNINKVLQPAQESTIISGAWIRPEIRLFVSKPKFVLSTVILGLYLLSTIVLYVRRPWKILPRMPTTIASQIAFFASSHTLNDLKGTTTMTGKERNRHVECLGTKYGFGRFLGTDGKVHVGIEREPLVQLLKKKDLREPKIETGSFWNNLHWGKR